MANTLKIGIDVGPLQSGDSIRGIGTYVRELTNSLEKLQNSKIQIKLFSDRGSLFTEHFDVVHFTRFNPFQISVPFNKPQNIKFILTIYDLIPLIYPKHYPPGVKGKIRFLINKYLINKNVDAIITISETSKKDICRFLKINPKRVFVTHLAAPPVFKKIEGRGWRLETIKKYNLPDKFVLYAGDINYNKNIPNLVKACKIAKLPLVIAGKQAADVEKMDMNHSEHKHLKNVDWSNAIHLGFVPDSDLVKLYNLAAVYAQPSFYEGFSLPPLQAVICGTPLAISKNQCHVEIFGDNFEYFDPNNPEDIANKLLNPNKNKKLPKKYSWETTANETTKIYESI